MDAEQKPIEKKKGLFGLFKKKEKVEKISEIVKDPEKKKGWFQKLKTGLFKSSEKIRKYAKRHTVYNRL